jgi:hypothetical protein
MTAKQAATELGYLKTNGKVKDSFYTAVAPKIGVFDGNKWTCYSDRVETHRRGEIG